MILLALNVNMDKSSAIKQALKQSMPNQWTQSYQLLMSTWTQAQLSMSKGAQAHKQSMSNQWAQSYRLLMSIQTQA